MRQLREPTDIAVLDRQRCLELWNRWVNDERIRQRLNAEVAIDDEVSAAADATGGVDLNVRGDVQAPPR